jgi:ribosomal protein S18 acetylase RimI-like enzyme
MDALAREVAWQPDVAAGEISVSHVETLSQPLLRQVTALEEQNFPPCERLGPVLMQQQAALRTSGLLLAEMGAALSGYLLFTRTGSAGLITKLAVSAAFRRRGVGSALLRRGIEELERPSRRLPPTEIQLHVDPARTEARRLYEAFGFERVTLLPGYYSDSRDALLMRRISPGASGENGPSTR